MTTAQRNVIDRNIAFIVLAAIVVFLTAGAMLNAWSERQLRQIVAEQFNQEQLVIARNVAERMEHEFHSLKKEILYLGKQLRATEKGSDPTEQLRESFLRVRDTGVWRIACLNRDENAAVAYPDGEGVTVADAVSFFAGHSPHPYTIADDGVWVSKLQITSKGIFLQMAVDLPQTRRQVQFYINLAWMLQPILKPIHSGKTGYAWLISGDGTFLYHPKTAFIGQNAFTVRGRENPLIDYGAINAIQKENMLRGQEGMGSYFSSWHRDQSGKIKKLIAYAPVEVSRQPPQKWSVAVVAPISEIESEVQKGLLRQFVLQGLIVAVILTGAGFVYYFEKRWSSVLAELVAQRTLELAKSEEKYRSLVESAEDFIFTVDRRGYFQSMNSFTASFFGGRTEDFVGKHLGRLFPKEVARQQQELVDLVTRQGKSVRCEYELQTENVNIWINANFMPIKNEAGDIGSILCIARDTTENKNLERQLVNAEKLASLGTLAAGVAHEINNPLGVILGFADLLLRKTDPDTQAYEDLKTIERQGLLCKEVVENLLSFARIGGGDGAYSDVNFCLREIVKIVGHVMEMNNIDLSLDLQDNLPRVRGDSRQLQQVFLNLINNAIAAMSETGGRLAIRTDISGNPAKAAVYFEDNGPGIPREDMDRIFEPFFTTKPEGQGTGLGLFVSYGIVSKYGGTMECVSHTANQSDGERGTSFIVYLPIQQQEE